MEKVKLQHTVQKYKSIIKDYYQHLYVDIMGNLEEMDKFLKFSSFAQSCSTLCNPIDCSTPGFHAHHQLLELAQIHVESVMPSNHFILCCPLLLLPSIFSSIRAFLVTEFFASGGQVLEFHLQHLSLQ